MRYLRDFIISILAVVFLGCALYFISIWVEQSRMHRVQEKENTEIFRHQEQEVLKNISKQYDKVQHKQTQITSALYALKDTLADLEIQVDVNKGK